MNTYEMLIKELATRIAKVRAMLDIEEEVSKSAKPGHANRLFEMYLERNEDEWAKEFKGDGFELDADAVEEIIDYLQDRHADGWMEGIVMWDDLFVGLVDMMNEMKDEEVENA